ncbi:hypothetical protein Bca4012_019185 [Brassica carinata]
MCYSKQKESPIRPRAGEHPTTNAIAFCPSLRTKRRFYIETARPSPMTAKKGWRKYSSKSIQHLSNASLPLSSITHIVSHRKSVKSMFHSPRIRFQADPSVVAIVFRGKGDFDGVLKKLCECGRGREHGRRNKMRRASFLYQVYTETMDGTVRMGGIGWDTEERARTVGEYR